LSAIKPARTSAGKKGQSGPPGNDSILSSVLTGVVECSVRSGYRAADLTAKLEKPYALLNE
jgi:hypothetical protein